MPSNFEKLLDKSVSDPSLLMALTATYLDEIASSRSGDITKKSKEIQAVFTNNNHKNSPLANALSLLCQGASNFYLTNYQQAKDTLSKALANFKEGLPKDILASIYWALGVNYRSLGAIDKATEFLLKAKEAFNQSGLFKLTYAYTNYQLGEIHVAIGEFNNAESYYNEAYRVIQQSDNITANFRILDGLGICMLYLNKIKESESYFSKALGISGISAAEKSRALCDLGRVYLTLENYPKALKLIEESLSLRVQHNLEDAASTSLIYLAEINIQLNKIDDAISALDKALKTTLKYKAQSKQIKVLKLFSIAYQRKKQYKKALEFLMKYDTLNREVLAKQEHEIFRMKNKQIEDQKLRIENQRNQLKETLDELAKVKTSRKSLFFSVGTAIVLVILTEAFFDPVIDSYAYNVYISLTVKVFIALLLKPMDNFYERILLKKAMQLK